MQFCYSYCGTHEIVAALPQVEFPSALQDTSGFRLNGAQKFLLMCFSTRQSGFDDKCNTAGGCPTGNDPAAFSEAERSFCCQR